MNIVKVTYTTKAAFAGENAANIGKVMTDLRLMDYPGVFYHCCLAPDGCTFTHTAFFKTENDRALINSLPSFQHFQQQLKASMPEVAPQLELMTLIGSSRDIFEA